MLCTRTVFACCLLLASAAQSEEAPATTDLFALVPADAKLVAAVRFPESRSEADAERWKLVRNSHPAILPYQLTEAGKQTGLDPDLIGAAVVFSTGADLAYAVAMRKAYDRAAVLNAFVGTDATEQKFGGHVCFVAESAGRAVCFVDEKTVLFSSPDQLRLSLTSDAKSGPLDVAGYADLINKQNAFAALALAGRASDVEVVEPLNFEFTFLPTETGLRCRVAESYLTEDAAEEAADAFAEFAELLASYLEQATQQMPAFAEKQAADYPGIKPIVEPMAGLYQRTTVALKMAEPTRKGRRNFVEIDVMSQTPSADVALLLTLMPRAQK